VGTDNDSERTPDPSEASSPTRTWPAMVPLVSPPAASSRTGRSPGEAYSSNNSKEDIWYVRKASDKKVDDIIGFVMDLNGEGEGVDTDKGGEGEGVDADKGGESSNTSAKKKKKKKKKKKGFVTTSMTRKAASDYEGKKLALEWNAATNLPICPMRPSITHKRVIRDIGSIIRAWVPMKAEKWDSLDEEHQKILQRKLRVSISHF
jgi:hypothetical protein